MRNRAEVNATLQTAKVNPAELLPVVHCLSFGPQAAAGECCLLQLEPGLCAEIEAGCSLVIRGEKDEQAVLCSKDKTYDMKIADTSNMLLFVPGCKTPEQLNADQASCNIIHSQIAGFSNNYWELRRCRPKLKKLRKLLMEDPYEGPDSRKDQASTFSKYTTEDLLSLIQASEEEILHHLQVIDACKIEGASHFKAPRSASYVLCCYEADLKDKTKQALTSLALPRLMLFASCPISEHHWKDLWSVAFCTVPLGYWRILEFDYEMKLLNHVIQLIDSESWSLKKVPLRTCLEELGSLEPTQMIEHILLSYGRKYLDNAGEVYFEMHEDKICRAIAQMLLQNAVKFNLSEFQEVWQQSVPEGMTTRLDQLQGLALLDRSSRPETIFLLKVEDLPEGNQERFNSLFSIREKWTELDITPYIQDLCAEKQTVGVLLTKYARCSMQNGVKVYNSRRPIS